MPALSRRNAGGLLGVTLVLFAVWTALTAAGALWGMDHDVASEVARTYDDTGDVAFSLVAVTASAQLSAVWLAVLALLALAHPRWRAAVILLAVLLVAGLGLELILKVVLDHPGPYPTRALVLFGGAVEPGSFPSGHMIRGTALAITTVLLIVKEHRRAALTVVAAYIAALAWSRVYLNEHWTSDVLGGLLLGLAAALAVVAAPVVPRGSR